MSQRDSGYQRKERDAYNTPEWVTEAVLPHLPFVNGRRIWEPACGLGKMLAILDDRLGNVMGTDIESGTDFLETPIKSDVFGVITNPPYSLADAFIIKALLQTAMPRGFVAMLLRTDFDHAKTRRPIFASHQAFSRKVVLTRRIVWFEKEGKKAAPSYNHAWFIWDWQHKGRPTLAYGP